MYTHYQLIKVGNFQLELKILELIEAKIAQNCVTGAYDWNIKQILPIPTPCEILIEAIESYENPSIAEILRISAWACVDTLSLYRIDNVSDLEARISDLNLSFEPNYAKDLVLYFTVCYDGIEEGDPPDPTHDPFYERNC